MPTDPPAAPAPTHIRTVRRWTANAPLYLGEARAALSAVQKAKASPADVAALAARGIDATAVEAQLKAIVAAFETPAVTQSGENNVTPAGETA